MTYRHTHHADTVIPWIFPVSAMCNCYSVEIQGTLALSFVPKLETFLLP